MSGLTFGAIGPAAPQSAAAPTAAKSNTAADEFLAYMKKSSAERIQEAWLAAHGLTKEKLAAMKPDERDAVLEQMAKEIKDQVAQAATETTEKKKPAP